MSIPKLYLGSTLVSPRAVDMNVTTAPRTSSTDATIPFVSVTPNATAHTKGAWAQLIASTSQAIDGITLLIASTTAGSTLANNILLDIGTGGSGSESVLVANAAVPFNTATTAPTYLFVPVRVASGTRIAVRCQIGRASAAAISVAAMLHAYPANTITSPTAIDTIGAVTASSSGVAVSSNNTWFEVTASTSQAYRGVVICPTSSDASMAASTASFDLGVGPAASEVAYLGASALATQSTEYSIQYGSGNYIAVSGGIPAGSRLAVRVIDASIATNAGWSVTLLGVPE